MQEDKYAQLIMSHSADNKTANLYMHSFIYIKENLNHWE